MKAKIRLIIAALLLIIGSVILIRTQDESESKQPIASETNHVAETTKASCIADECLEIEDLEYPAGELPDKVADALNSAIDDEYKARATYEAVMNEIGSVRPFSMIIRAEEQHISSLKALFDKYGLDVPADAYSNVEVASSKAANCSVGVQAEIDNAALYRDSLLPAAAGYPDITSVFTSLMNASQDKHLPAFEKCAE